ncbi:alpha/beta hydrolase [Methanonatronarchaeum sp. AMET-Sl]|uniref:alpha/beta fold hydrolase n=1 Tax=Methanonatronarchaeum sp. AMET-Sl TaxID=3037654 RepID=UPI00244DE709|nr:alpha/beta hydrolase [Methanonatronarchaeum sp. AMET-Sl]WGI18068.1 alpha/beta hydrolase [Methanonatronarchaeum sp. AMET-Sl]
MNKIETKKGEIYYKTVGQPQKPAILLIHGVGLNHQTWKPQIKELKKNHYLTVLDLPGHGRSYKNRQFNLNETTEIIKKILDEIQQKQISLIGQSIGGLITQHYTNKYPETVKKLIVLGSPSLYHGLDEYTTALFKIHSQASKITPWKILKQSAKSELANKPTTQRYIEKTLNETGKKQLINISEEIQNTVLTGIPKPINKPIQLIHGDQDLKFIQKQMKEWHNKQPNTQYKKIKNAGHIANQDNPKEFNKTIKNFLKNTKK